MNLNDLFLPKWIKGLTIVFLLGVTVAAGFHLVSRYYQNRITENEREADRLRQEARDAYASAIQYKSVADGLKKDLDKANKKLAKLEHASDQIKIPPSPGPAPAIQQIVSDLQKNGFELVLKPSSGIKPAVFGVTEPDAKLMWTNTMQALRIPAFEAKIQAQQNYISGLVDAKRLAEDYAASRAKQAEQATKASDTYKQEADTLRMVVSDSKKALAAERRKKIVYSIGAAATGYLAGRQLTRAN